MSHGICHMILIQQLVTSKHSYNDSYSSALSLRLRFFVAVAEHKVPLVMLLLRRMELMGRGTMLVEM